MTDDRTAHLSLPLPHPTNALDEDVGRLRTSLNGIDAKFAALDALLMSDDETLDQLQELVTQIKANKSTITAILADKANASDLAATNEVVAGQATDIAAMKGRLDTLESRPVAQPVEESVTLTADQTVIDLTTLTGASGASVFVEGVRLRSDEWTPHATVLTRLTLSKTYPAGHVVTVTRLQ